VSQQSSNSYSFEADFSSHQTPPPVSQAKLRFNENVTVSKFDSNSNKSHMFEDDFAGRAEMEQEMADQWNEELRTNVNGNKKSLKERVQQQGQENIRKSESVNIFAKKADDPFEDDDFFSPGGKDQDPFNSSWEKNFANFDDNV
jgi:disabled family protein 2